MAAKATTVTLAHKVGGVAFTKEFEFDHAQRLLDMQNNGGWYLADESFELADNGTIVRGNKKGDKRAEKKK